MDTSKFEKYSTDIAVKGLLISIQLNSVFCLNLYNCKPDEENSLKNLFPVLINAIVRAGTQLNIWDQNIDVLNGIAADEIEKAGALIRFVRIISTG